MACVPGPDMPSRVSAAFLIYLFNSLDNGRYRIYAQATVSRVGYQDMTHHFCGRPPSVLCPVGPEEVGEPVEIGLHVPGKAGSSL